MSTIEEWENHIHLSGGLCFEMNFLPDGDRRRFKVVEKDSFGNITAKDCLTGEAINFNRHHLMKREYATLVEVDCDGC